MKIRFIGIYGWSEMYYKYKTWGLIKELVAGCNVLLIIGGGFNEIFLYEEKQGGVPREQRYLDDFREVFEMCGFRDIGAVGLWFVWERGRKVENNIG